MKKKKPNTVTTSLDDFIADLDWEMLESMIQDYEYKLLDKKEEYQHNKKHGDPLKGVSLAMEIVRINHRITKYKEEMEKRLND